MNNDSFLRYIENSCDCNQEWLDIAVTGGLRRAKNDRFDPKKILLFAAACVLTFAMFITINSASFEIITDRYNQRVSFDADSSRIINNYLVDIIINIKKNIGGE